MSLTDELAAWRAECDKVGVPHDAAMLVRHHRANAGLTAALDARSRTIEDIKAVRAECGTEAEQGVCDAILRRVRSRSLPRRCTSST